MSGGLRRFIRGELVGLKLPQLWHLVAGVVVAVAALFGGLDDVEAKPTVFKVDQPYSDGEFTMTVKRAVLLDDVRAGEHVLLPAVPGRSYLGLSSRIRNDGPIRGHLDTGVGGPEFDLQLPNKEFAGAYRIADGSIVASMGPKLSDDLLFLWKVPTGEVKPDSTVTVRVSKKILQQMVVTYGLDWLPSDTVFAQVVVPVVKR
ncbi:hypothetical protein PT015_06145 [Candidatus Mycobacterium wuenschmannii]|uniref:Secreted protein n=1 Tax=Candidatus Mycobacterium wuenschmannii TaxID=3027808 RepID=A0ABY8W5I4_9MYCO|nr:hypothetical protein [Candidatus Mycobacterium wuenschmannii]WIM89049.1 hypothetical protein PT015_06145 [Candidatus Mycobacterium wuenschmannii]